MTGKSACRFWQSIDVKIDMYWMNHFLVHYALWNRLHWLKFMFIKLNKVRIRRTVIKSYVFISYDEMWNITYYNYLSLVWCKSNLHNTVMLLLYIAIITIQVKLIQLLEMCIKNRIFLCLFIGYYDHQHNPRYLPSER